MNPEQTRNTHETATLEGARNQIFDGNNGRLTTTIDNLAQAKATARKGSWLGFRAAKGNPNDAINTANDAVNKELNDYTQIEARIRADARRGPGGAELTTDEYREALAEEVAVVRIQAESRVTAREVELARASETGWRNLVRRAMRNGAARAAVGWGLNAGIGVAVASGNVPVAAILMGARVGFGAYGTEAMARGITDRIGDRTRVNNEQVFGRGGAGGMNMEEVNRRLAAFAEMRIRDKSENLTDTEQLLMQRKQLLIRNEVMARLTAANVENWRNHRSEFAVRQTEFNNAETARAAAEAEVNTQEAARAAAETARDGRRDEATKQEGIRDAAEAARIHAESVRDTANNILTMSANPNKAETGFIKQFDIGGRAVDVAATIDAARRHVEADEEITRLEGLRGLTPPPADLDVLIAAQRNIRDLAHDELFNSTWNVETVVNAYGGRKRALADIANKPLERDAAERARADADNEANNQEAARAAAEAAKTAAVREVANQQTLKTAAETAMNNANNLTEDQAIMIYNMLVGGGARAAVAATPTAGDRPAIADTAAANSILGQEAATRNATRAIDRERNFKKGRWLAALAVSGLVTFTSQGYLDQFNAPVANFIKEQTAPYIPDWISSVQAAEAAQQTGGVATDVASGAKEAMSNSGFFDQVVQIKEQGSNFWRSLNLSGLENNWENPSNGVHKSDVIKDMIVKFARHNGRELNLVHVGDTFKLKDLLTPDQMKVISEAANTRDVSGYVSSVMPKFSALMGR